MIIFVKEKNEIVKYNVLFDKEKLERLEYDIIEYCSIIEHYDYKDTNFPKMYGLLDHLKYRNYSSVAVGVMEYNDFYSMPETLYRIKFDKYHFPYLVQLLGELISGNVMALEDIFTINEDKELKPLDKRIEEINEKINNTDNIKANEKIELLNKLSELIKQKELNKNQISVNKYYLKARKLITFKKVDSISYSELERILNFYNIQDEKEYIDKKILRYNRKNS